MSLYHLGSTRSCRRPDHLLHTPDTFVQAPLPGMTRGTAVMHAAPVLGAAFVQYTAMLDANGTLGSTAQSRFVYVLEGAVRIASDSRERTLEAGGYAYLPPDGGYRTVAGGDGARLAVLEKPYVPSQPGQVPPALFSSVADVESAALLGDEAIQVKSLLGSNVRYDFAVNVMEYAPGARLPMVEVHVMEHGLLMLEGEGIYRLGDSWYPVAAGDFIWMGAFCPQWFGALGPKPAKYLIYKDWNRHPCDVAPAVAPRG